MLYKIAPVGRRSIVRYLLRVVSRSRKEPLVLGAPAVLNRISVCEEKLVLLTTMLLGSVYKLTVFAVQPTFSHRYLAMVVGPTV